MIPNSTNDPRPKPRCITCGGPHRVSACKEAVQIKHEAIEREHQERIDRERGVFDLEYRRARLWAYLWTFGAHRIGCAALAAPDASPLHARCSCGLAAVLRETLGKDK